MCPSGKYFALHRISEEGSRKKISCIKPCTPIQLEIKQEKGDISPDSILLSSVMFYGELMSFTKEM